MFGLDILAKRDDAVKSAQPSGVVNIDVGVSEIGEFLAPPTVNERLLADIRTAAQ